MILLDTSGVLAALDTSQTRYAEVRRVLDGSPGLFLLSPFVLAELDYLIATRLGERTRFVLLEDVATGAYELVTFDAQAAAAALVVMRQYRDLRVSLADASIVVLANRYGVADVLTLDERHFRVLRAGGGRPFRLLPADA